MPFQVVDHPSFGPIIDITQVDDPWAEFLKVTLQSGQTVVFEIERPTVMKFMRTPNDILAIAFDESDVSVEEEVVRWANFGSVVIDNEQFLGFELDTLKARIIPGIPKRETWMNYMPVIGKPLTVGVHVPPSLIEPLAGQTLRVDYTFGGGPIASIESIVLEDYGASRRPAPDDPHYLAHLEMQRIHEEQSGK